jgi:hypothetical protein
MKIWLYLLARKPVKGFTLLELLMASILTFLVVSATGYAVVLMTRDNIASSVSSDLQFNTNRASDFIADEIKQSSVIFLDNTITLPTGCPATLDSDEEFIFGLSVDSSTNVNVVYYTKTPPDNPWRGPSSIYRCGIGLSSTGAYTGTINTILVDSISTEAEATDDNCSVGTQFPDPPAAGFYICASDDGDDVLDTPVEKVIEIHLTSTSTDLIDRGLDRQSQGSSSGNYSVVTKVFARSGAP